jgi:hypothetical protein
MFRVCLCYIFQQLWKKQAKSVCNSSCLEEHFVSFLAVIAINQRKGVSTRLRVWSVGELFFPWFNVGRALQKIIHELGIY